MKRLGIFLTLLFLIAGMSSCATSVVVERAYYTLTIAGETGGSVTTPGEGKFVYNSGSVVPLVAEAEEGYRFVTWTGNVGTIGDVNAATTSITMNSNYSVVARFEEILPEQYNLTITSTAGGRVLTPGEGMFLREEGSLVNLVAEAEDGYWFVEWTGDTDAVVNTYAAITTITVNDDYAITAEFREWVSVNPMIAAGYGHTVGLKSNGTAVAVGLAGRDLRDWTGIVYVATAGDHTVGLRADGTVVAVGDNDDGRCDIGGWTDIVQVAAGCSHTVGLKSNGTVVAVGWNDDGRCDVGRWMGIIQVAGGHHTVGLKLDGTVVAVGDNSSGQCDVGDWKDISQVDAACSHTVGLKSDGTVVAVGYDYNGQFDFDDWTDIVQVAAAASHTVGLKSDGTVVAVGYNFFGECDVDDWTDIVQVAVGDGHTVGLKSDGTVVAVGYNEDGQCNVHGWNLGG